MIFKEADDGGGCQRIGDGKFVDFVFRLTIHNACKAAIGADPERAFAIREEHLNT